MKQLSYPQQVQEAYQYLSQRISISPKIGLILGSGLGIIADQLDGVRKFAFSEIPHFPLSTVAGHEGELIFGSFNGKEVMLMKGRVHYYEGYSMQEVTFPVRVMQVLGINTLIVTNACGGLRDGMQAGDICLIKDHINLMGDSPLRGKNIEAWGPRFPDMSKAYTPQLLQMTKEVAKGLGIAVSEGVYAAVTGPCYETHAEAAYLEKIGTDLVGMSTVPEVIVAAHGGMKVLGISSITDVLAQQHDEPITHEQVVKVAGQMRPKLIQLLNGILKKINTDQ